MVNERNENGKSTAEQHKIKGDWDKQSKALKVNYPRLTDEDLKYEEGNEKDLYQRLENRLGKNRNEVIGIIKTNNDTVS